MGKNIPECINLYEEAILETKTDTTINEKEIINSYLGLGVCFKSIGNIEEGMKYYNKAMNKSILSNNYSLNNILLSIGNIHAEIGEYQKAIKYYSDALKLEQPKNEKILIIYNLGAAYQMLEQYEKANSFLNESYELALAFKDVYSQFYATSGLVNNYIDLCQEKKSFQFLEIEKKISHEIGYNYYKAAYFYDYARFNDKFLKLKKEEILFNFERAFALFEKDSAFTDLIDVSTDLQIFCEKNKFYEKAIFYSKKFNYYNSKIINDDTKEKLISLKVQFEIEKNNIKKEQQLKEKIRIENDAAQKKSKLQYTIILLAIILIFIITIFSGKLQLKPIYVNGLIFISFLIFFESLVIFTEDYFNFLNQNEPLKKLSFNFCLALLIFPFHI